MPLTDKELAQSLIDAIVKHNQDQPEDGSKIMVSDKKSLERVTRMAAADYALWATFDSLIKNWKQEESV